MDKPKRCCHPACFNCPYRDCLWDGYSPEEKAGQDKYDRHLLDTADPGRRKNRERVRRYLQTEKGKATTRRYIQSPKGRESQKRKTQRKVESGKNAEYCRMYYRRKKKRMS